MVDGPPTLVIYPGADGKFTLYEDEGATFNYRRGEYTKIDLNWNDSRRILSIKPARTSRSVAHREIEVRLVPDKTTRKAVFGGGRLS